MIIYFNCNIYGFELSWTTWMLNQDVLSLKCVLSSLRCPGHRFPDGGGGVDLGYSAATSAVSSCQ